MTPIRDVQWAVRLATAGTMLCGALLLAAHPALAAPTAPVSPTELAPPPPPVTTLTLPPSPTKPKPAIDVPATDLVAEPPCWQLETCPPPVDPCADHPEQCPPPSQEPSDPPTTKPEPTTTTPVGQPRPAPSGIPTPTRIDTGAGPVSEPPTWLFWVLPGLALLTLLSGLTGWWLARSEQVKR